MIKKRRENKCSIYERRVMRLYLVQLLLIDKNDRRAAVLIIPAADCHYSAAL